MSGEITKTNVEEKMSLKQKQAKGISLKYRIVRFRGAVLYWKENGWEPLSSDGFARICYEIHGAGIRQTQIKDLQHLFFTSSEDLSEYAKYLAMPDGYVWDMEKLEFNTDVASEDCVYTTSVAPTDGKSHRKWLEEVARGDKDLAQDMLQGIAPVFMYKKPLGVFWFIGNGANGKSTLLKSLYAIFGSQSPYTNNTWFSQLSVRQIEDDRHVLSLNGNLANICLESNDGHIKDTGNYKNLAEHSTFGVRVLGTHDTKKVDGNIHSVQNANNIPTFSDKTSGTKRRTFVVPFKAQFSQDDTFDEKLFTSKNFLSDLLGELLEVAKDIKKRGYKYSFSDATIKAKEDYDEEVNTAETYFEELIQTDVWGFTNFTDLTRDYHSWCDERSYTALGKKSIAHAAKVAGFERRSYRNDGRVVTRYIADDLAFEDMVLIPHRFGMFQKSNSEFELETSESSNVDNLYDNLISLL